MPDSLLTELSKYYSQFSETQKKAAIIVSITNQTLYLFKHEKCVSRFLISSAEAGIGNLEGSFQTPLGAHKISEKIGKNAPIASIFKARKNTKKIATILKKADEKSDDDNITSRILRLEGLEKGVNRGTNIKGNNVDSSSRYIYIHGTDEEGRLGQAVSHGCIRMANQDIITLFNHVSIDSLVIILNTSNYNTTSPLID